jgi:hypothetical protein
VLCRVSIQKGAPTPSQRQPFTTELIGSSLS